MWEVTDEVRMSPESPVRVRRPLVESGLMLDLVFHTEAFAFDNHRVGVMQQPIQDSGGQGAVLVEYRGPLLKGAVGGTLIGSRALAACGDVDGPSAANN